MGEKPFIKLGVSVSLGPGIVADSRIFGGLYFPPGLFNRSDHFPAQPDWYDFVRIPVEIPYGQGTVFLGPLDLPPTANGGDGGKLRGVFSGRGPSAEASLTESGEIDPGWIDRVFLQKLVH